MAGALAVAAAIGMGTTGCIASPDYANQYTEEAPRTEPQTATTTPRPTVAPETTSAPDPCAGDTKSEKCAEVESNTPPAQPINPVPGNPDPVPWAEPNPNAPSRKIN
jgi:hypothetical protein